MAGGGKVDPARVLRPATAMARIRSVRWAALAAISLGFGLVQLDVTIVDVALTSDRRAAWWASPSSAR
jgi:hypothetical protein